MIHDAERAALLATARYAIAESLGLAAPASRVELPPRQAGVFVSLHAEGRLRGCIGQLEADRPLVDLVASCAVSAAHSDPRFAPLTAAELAVVRIEVSVLGSMEPVTSVDEIVVGTHGLLVEEGRRRGLLLPQVAVEWEWDAVAFVAQTCRKAGLPTAAWPRGGAALYRFEAEVFGEVGRPQDADH